MNRKGVTEMIECFLFIMLLVLLSVSVFRLCRLLAPTQKPSALSEEERLCRRLASTAVVEISRLCPPGLSLRCTPTVEKGRFYLNFELKNGSVAACCRDGARLLVTADLLDRNGAVIESVGIDIDEDLPPEAYLADMVSLDRAKLAVADRLCVKVLLMLETAKAA